MPGARVTAGPLTSIGVVPRTLSSKTPAHAFPSVFDASILPSYIVISLFAHKPYRAALKNGSADRDEDFFAVQHRRLHAGGSDDC